MLISVRARREVRDVMILRPVEPPSGDAKRTLAVLHIPQDEHTALVVFCNGFCIQRHLLSALCPSPQDLRATGAAAASDRDEWRVRETPSVWLGGDGHYATSSSICASWSRSG